jgi:hypothetical protein
MLHLRIRKSTRLLPFLLTGCFFTHCATTHFHHPSDHTRNVPFTEKIKKAAVSAVTSPRTWVPLTGAVLIHSTNSDYRIAQWASSTNPVFGSQARADHISDICVSVARDAFIISAFLDAPPPLDYHWLNNQLQNFAVGLSALYLNRRLVDHLKVETARLRPDASDHKSYPSGHTSEAAINTTLASRNIGSMHIAGPYKTVIQHGLYLTTITTAWARVEANRHYPSDVLVGMAIGNFIGSFIHDAFMDRYYADTLSFETDPITNRFQLNLALPF